MCCSDEAPPLLENVTNRMFCISHTAKEFFFHVLGVLEFVAVLCQLQRCCCSRPCRPASLPPPPPHQQQQHRPFNHSAALEHPAKRYFFCNFKSQLWLVFVSPRAHCECLDYSGPHSISCSHLTCPCATPKAKRNSSLPPQKALRFPPPNLKP